MAWEKATHRDVKNRFILYRGGSINVVISVRDMYEYNVGGSKMINEKVGGKTIRFQSKGKWRKKKNLDARGTR